MALPAHNEAEVHNVHLSLMQQSTLPDVSEKVRTTVTVPAQLARAAAEQAEREHASRASVLARWLQRGHDVARADALLSAYDEFYAEPDTDAPPPALRRRRAAEFDARWD